MKKKIIALCLVATFCLVTANMVAAASKPRFSVLPQIGLLTSVLTQDNESDEPVSAWDRTWPVLLAVGSFFLFKFLRSMQAKDDDDY